MKKEEILDQVIEVVEKTLRVSDIDEDTFMQDDLHIESLDFYSLLANIEKQYEQITIIKPPITQANIPSGILPFVIFRIFWALKKIPEPITIPTTILIAVINPYFLFNLFSIN